MRIGKLVVTHGRVTLEGGIVVIDAHFGSYRQKLRNSRLPMVTHKLVYATAVS